MTDDDLEKMMKDDDDDGDGGMPVADEESHLINFDSPDGKVDLTDFVRSKKKASTLGVTVHVVHTVKEKDMEGLMNIWLTGLRNNYVGVKGAVASRFEIAFLFSRSLDFERNKEYLLSQPEVEFIDDDKIRHWGHHSQHKPKEEADSTPVEGSETKIPPMQKRAVKRGVKPRSSPAEPVEAKEEL